MLDLMHLLAPLPTISGITSSTPSRRGFIPPAPSASWRSRRGDLRQYKLDWVTLRSMLRPCLLPLPFASHVVIFSRC